MGRPGENPLSGAPPPLGSQYVSICQTHSTCLDFSQGNFDQLELEILDKTHVSKKEAANLVFRINMVTSQSHVANMP